MQNSPAFGQADLSNCERELIHLAGSVQPHGVLLVLQEPQLRIQQVSANSLALLGIPAASLLNQALAELGGDIDNKLRALAASSALADPVTMSLSLRAHGKLAEFECSMHRNPAGVLIVELEPMQAMPSAPSAIDMDGDSLLAFLGEAIDRFSAASTIGTLTDAVVRCYRELVGYDRVMVYKFDPDGHGKIIAEARDPRLESLLGHHYPASDIPQRARELYIRNRLRVLADVHYEPAPLVPQRMPETGAELDMSLCHLRSMSPLHLQYLKNMGVTATLVVSLVRDGRLWGLIACHHDSPRNLRFAVRAAADLLAEVVATRIAAVENYAHAQVAIQVRRLEQRLVEATSTEGDWRLALFRNARTLLQPLDATAAALFHEGEVLTTGEAPSTPELRALMAWVETQPFDTLFSCSSVARANPAFDSLTPTASGVLAVRLSKTRPDYLMWFRKEQLLSVTWAGDPSKSAIGNDPMELSPRRSFAAWSEIVRGTALPWSASELALARAFGASLVDIIVQINAVRLLIAEHQLAQIREAVASSSEPVLVVDAKQRTLFANDAFFQLTKRTASESPTPDEMASLFAQPEIARRMFSTITQERRPWRGELDIDMRDGTTLPAAVRAEVVAARDGSILGFFLILSDLSETQRAASARRQLEESLAQVRLVGSGEQAKQLGAREPDGLMAAILANASLAAMDIADSETSPGVASLLQELESGTKRAAALYWRIRSFS